MKPARRTEDVGEQNFCVKIMIEVKNNRFGKSVYAAQPIKKGTVILSGWGPIISERTQHSIQVGSDEHVLIDGPLQLINHSCEPNCGVAIHNELKSLEIHAIEDIVLGQELYIDYATFEYEIEHFPERCLCQKASCRGIISGFKDLPEHVRDAYGPYIAKHLRETENGVVSR